MSYSVIVAGSTTRTVLCAEALLADPRFTLTGIITPSPKPIGRKHILTKNPLQLFGEEHALPITLIEKKIDSSIQAHLETVKRPDFLLVVDFGYIVPKWLLVWPTIAPVNVHPSHLPKYRGSSPGQFSLLFGEKESAVTVMVMDEALDHGPIITSLPFSVDSNWTASDYYELAFNLVTKELGEILVTFAKTPHSTPQPDDSSTPIARMLSREDGFIPYTVLHALLEGKPTPTSLPFLDSLSLPTTAQTLYNLWRGLTPWPGLWTLVHIGGVEKRMKILRFHLEEDRLFLDEVQVEGKNKTEFTVMQSLLGA